MPKVRVNTFSISLDGYGAGPDQSLEAPLGRGGESLHDWFVGTRTFRRVYGKDEGTTGTDETFAARGMANLLTHHERAPLEMKGGTVFHFVTGGIEEALSRARQAAGECDIRIGGGASTIRQFLEARLIDEMHVAISPVLLGAGEPLLQGIDLPALGYEVTEHVASEKATHVVFTKR